EPRLSSVRWTDNVVQPGIPSAIFADGDPNVTSCAQKWLTLSLPLQAQPESRTEYRIRLRAISYARDLAPTDWGRFFHSHRCRTSRCQSRNGRQYYHRRPIR